MRKITDRIVWTDLETTGLDPCVDLVLEVSVVITDYNLDTIAELKSVVIHRTREDIDAVIDSVCREMHTSNGLLDESLSSKISISEAEAIVLDFITEHTQKKRAVLGGFSVGFDRSFLAEQMPYVADHLHYRNIDVSTLRELIMRWIPDFKSSIATTSIHRAYPDVCSSIGLLREYRSLLRSDCALNVLD